MSNLTVIGRAERVILLQHSNQAVPAKVDTGADTSSIWASGIYERADGLRFILFDEGSEYYSGQVINLKPSEYRRTRVANSFGQREERYVVKLRIKILNRSVNAVFTLADRSSKLYPILLGRRLLRNKFIVDVSKGEPLLAAEKAKLHRMHVELA